MSDTDIVVYSDYVCPFCYLGRESLDRYLATRERPFEIDWHPFDLRAGQRRPDGSVDPGVGAIRNYSTVRSMRRAAVAVSREPDLSRSIDRRPARRRQEKGSHRCQARGPRGG